MPKENPNAFTGHPEIFVIDARRGLAAILLLARDLLVSVADLDRDEGFEMLQPIGGFQLPVILGRQGRDHIRNSIINLMDNLLSK